jgi:tripartite-type tricarboxylate transporter receptor subunit TctC
MKRRLVLLLTAVVSIGAGFFAVGNASAQSYPEKTIRIISPFPPGGANDIIARLIAQKLEARLGRTVVVENKPGAAGGIGASFVAAASPDGYTLLMGTLATHGINPSVYKSLPYDAVRDFAPVALVASIPIVIVANPSLPADDVQGLIRLAKQNPGKLNFASSGLGSVNHLAGELFKSMTGTEIEHIPYKGSSPALTDLLGGQVKIMLDLLPSSLPHIKGGKLKAIAVTTPKRSSLLPNVPTLAESGLSGYSVTSWFGILAPAGTPKTVITTLNSEISAILRAPDVRDQMFAQGAEPYSSTPDEFAQVIKTDIETWAPLVKNLGLHQ